MGLEGFRNGSRKKEKDGGREITGKKSEGFGIKRVEKEGKHRVLPLLRTNNKLKITL